MSKCTMSWCGNPATHVVRWCNNMGQRFCHEHAEGVYLRDTADTTTLEKIDNGKGSNTNNTNA